MRLAYLVCLILVILGFLLNVTLSIIMLVWVKKDKVVETPKLVLYANIFHLIAFLAISCSFLADVFVFMYALIVYLFISIPILMFNIGILIRSIRERRSY
jgi:hypothetical protein